MRQYELKGYVVGKGKRNREQKRSQPAKPEMAPAADMPDPFDRPGPGLSPYTRRELGKSVDALQFLLNYLNYADEGTDDHGVDVDQLLTLIPAAENESSEQTTQRLDRAAKKLRVRVGNWAKLAAEVLTWIPENDAPVTVRNIFKEGAGWLEKSGYQPDPDAWTAGARMVLPSMCASNHWVAALDLLDAGAVQAATAPDPDVVAEFALGVRAQPVAAIHVAAALVTWLYQQPAAVPDPKAVYAEMAKRAADFAPMV